MLSEVNDIDSNSLPLNEQINNEQNAKAINYLQNSKYKNIYDFEEFDYTDYLGENFKTFTSPTEDRISVKNCIDIFTYLKNNENEYKDKENYKSLFKKDVYFNDINELERECLKIDLVLNKLNILLTTNHNTVNYDLAKNHGKLLNGRLFPTCKGNFQGIKHEVRNYILNKYCYDVDMINAHPTFLYNFAIQVGADKSQGFKNLEEYVKDRKGCLNKYKFDKTQFLIMLNWKNPLYPIENQFCRDIHSFIYTELIECLKLQFPKTYKHVNKTRTSNIDGSFVCLCNCQMENTFLCYAVKYLMDEGIKIHTLVFDGLIVYKNSFEGKNKYKVLKFIEEGIRNKFNFKIGFTFKEMEYKELLSDELINKVQKEEKALNEIVENKEVIDIENIDFFNYENNLSYDSLKKVFEKNHCFINELNSFLKYSKDEYILLKKDAFISAYSNRKFIDNKKNSITFIYQWFDDVKRKEYEKIDFDPSNKANKNIYNTWTGYRLKDLILNNYCEDLKMKSINIFNDFINHLCSYNNKLIENKLMKSTDYIKYWIADMLINPDKKNGISIVINGDQGTGKGTFALILKELLGKYCISISDAESALSKFNDILLNKICVIFDEALSEHMISKSAKLKNLISEPTLTIESKNIPSMTCKSSCRIIITTNDIAPIKIESKDRRYICLQPSIINKELTNNIYDFLLKNDNMKYIYDYLMEYYKELPQGFNWTKYRPISEVYEEIQNKFFRHEYMWLYEYSKEHNDVEVNFLDVKNHFFNSQIDNRIRYPMGSKQFEMFLGKFMRTYENCISSRKTNGNCLKKFNFNNIEEVLYRNDLYKVLYEEEEEIGF